MEASFFNAMLACKMHYDNFQSTFSPLYSSYGLQLSEDFAGIKALCLHYNRKTRSLWDALTLLPGEILEYTPRADKVKIKSSAAECTLAFYDTDAFVIDIKSEERVEFFAKMSKELSEERIEKLFDNAAVINAYSANGDDRDPDKSVPVSVGIRVIKGRLSADKSGVYALPENGEILAAIAMSALTVDNKITAETLMNAPESAEKAAGITREWIAECLKDADFEFENTAECEVLIKAVITLIFNLTKAQGNLKGCISSFPNRGSYPTHFMWDSCFQNLAYEKMNLNLAEDSLLQLCRNIRSDGKIPQFLCSTWVRPHDTQPALLGWAAKRLADLTDNREFIAEIFDALEKNNRWWLTQRMTEYGVIKCADGLETGQDNSPRFDNGTVLAVDMNSYLLSQLKVTAEFAEKLGFNEKAGYWKKKADALGARMIKYLYDKEKNLFFDADAVTGKKQALVTTSGLIPLWAGAPLKKEKIDAMIKDWLINPEYFYGQIPFPSVAYTEAPYDPTDWWRGPTWMPEAWLMVEILRDNGFEKEYRESVRRLYSILVADGRLHELFNSQTGEGMGSLEQGWTAAIFIKMYDIIRAHPG